MSDSVWPHRHQPTRLSCSWDSPGKKTGVGCHFLLQCMKVKSESEVVQLCLTLCDPIDISPSGSPAPGILQARTLEWVAICFSNAWKWKSESEVAQSCPTLSDPMDCSPPGSSIHGIFQARVLEWGAIAFSGGKVWESLYVCLCVYIIYLLFVYFSLQIRWTIFSEIGLHY